MLYYCCFFTIFYCSYLSMHEVKKPFAGIKKLSIWHGKPFFLLQKPFFFENQTFKKTFFFTKSSWQPVGGLN